MSSKNGFFANKSHLVHSFVFTMYQQKPEVSRPCSIC